MEASDSPMDLEGSRSLGVEGSPSNKKAKKKPEPEPFKGIHLQQYFDEEMQEGQEFECTDSFTKEHFHFMKWRGEMWRRGWDHHLGDFRWFLYKIFPRSRSPGVQLSREEGVKKAPE